MINYAAPLDNIDFLIKDVFDYPAHYARYPQLDEITTDLLDAIIRECAKFCEQELAPLNHVGDSQGCHFHNGEVTTPQGFKQAYQEYIQAGWQSLSYPVEYGGQGLPQSLGFIRTAMMSAANWSFNMYPGLTIGAVNTLLAHGSEEQKSRFLPKMCEGHWSGTMCLTEAHCGTDLGQIATRAVDNLDGSYTITGSKVFISAGEHDLTDNIIHIVLARVPGAPSGTRGISLFIVPKINLTPQGELAQRNAVSCGAIEAKMGIKASSTAVINFDGAKGFLLGPENKGLECMFTFMNTIRIGTSLQGVGAAELAYQASLPYAKARLSMRALTGKQCPDKAADPLIVHPDVRKMLLTQKAISEGGLAMVYYACKLTDELDLATDEQTRQKADKQLGLLTPILKAFLTETGFESANLGMQIFGGHGYVKETGIEQIVRDVRISTIYEGATGIQALDLLGRKIIMGKGKALGIFCSEILRFCWDNRRRPTTPQARSINSLLWTLSKAVLLWQKNTLILTIKAGKKRDIIGSASVEYLMFSGYIFMGYMWVKMALSADEKLMKYTPESPERQAFYQSKIDTAKFYFERVFPRIQSLSTTMMKDPDSLMRMTDPMF